MFAAAVPLLSTAAKYLPTIWGGIQTVKSMLPGLKDHAVVKALAPKSVQNVLTTAHNVLNSKPFREVERLVGSRAPARKPGMAYMTQGGGKRRAGAMMRGSFGNRKRVQTAPAGAVYTRTVPRQFSNEEFEEALNNEINDDDNDMDFLDNQGRY